jgi:hypothetical protein
MNTSYILTENFITLVISGEAVIIKKEDPRYEKAAKAIAEKNYEELNKAATGAVVSLAKALKAEIRNGAVELNGAPVDSYVAKKAMEIHESLGKTRPILAFIEKLDANPSFRIRKSLYEFLEYGKIPLTNDGCFLAYKKVREDYLDFFTATFDNSVGSVVTMPREAVDDNPNNTCSHGLHVCSYEYLSSYTAGRTMVVKVSPEDVVSIPADYNNTKMRVCRYKVVEELQEQEEPRWDIVEGHCDQEDEEQEDEEEIVWQVEEATVTLQEESVLEVKAQESLWDAYMKNKK